ncbi:MAG TPA: hypothetical protein VF480_06740 [Verrucomicrobiae bacterium]
MGLDKLTLKSQEALQEAQRLALLGQAEGLLPELPHVPAVSKPACRAACHSL